MINNKIKNISIIKTFMMLIVVLYHSIIFYTNNWFVIVEPAYELKTADLITKLLSSFHVQTFTFASGFLFYYLLKEKNKYIDLKKSIKSKFKRLVYPYIFTCIFWVIPISTYFYKYNFKDIFVKYVLIDSPSQLWFLIMLFLVFLFFLLFKDKINLSFKNLIYIYIYNNNKFYFKKV